MGRDWYSLNSMSAVTENEQAQSKSEKKRRTHTMHAELRAIHASRQQLGLDAFGAGVQLHLQRHAMALAKVHHNITNLHTHA